MAETAATTPEVSDEERDLQLRLGRALWRLEFPVAKSSVEDRQASWSEGRRKYAQQARHLLRYIDAEGLSISAKGASE